MFDFFRRSPAQRRAIEELRHVTEAELNDIGCDRAALTHLVSATPEINDRMVKMAALQGVSREELQNHRAELESYVSACERCGATGACKRTLADPNARAEEVDFCPNADAYREIAAGLA